MTFAFEIVVSWMMVCNIHKDAPNHKYQAKLLGNNYKDCTPTNILAPSWSIPVSGIFYFPISVGSGKGVKLI